MKIKDINGRVGVVDEVRNDGVFAHPEGTPYVVDDVDGLTMVANATLVTSTWWGKRPDNNYLGIWYDSPLDAFIEAKNLCQQRVVALC